MLGIPEVREAYCSISRGDVLEVSTCDRIFQFDSWANGLGVRARAGEAWRDEHHDRLLAFVSAARRSRDDHPARRFAASIPEEAVQLSTSAGMYEHTALRLLRHHPEAWDLARTAPRLFWIVCWRVGYQGIPVSECRDLLRMKRRDLLEQCVGSPCDGSAVRFIEKVTDGARGSEELRVIIEGARAPEVIHIFRHWKVVWVELLQSVLAASSWWHLRVFQDALRREAIAGFTPDEPDRVWEVSGFIADLRELGRALGFDEETVEIRLDDLRCWSELQTLHEQWVAALNAQSVDPRSAGTFPKEPVPGNSDIEPLTTPFALAHEGREMHHCVASYVRRCVQGESFVYRVLRPQRATLELGLDDARPYVRQLVTAYNGPVRADTRRAVEDWLASA